MFSIESLERRIQQLESRHAIAELVSSYAIACDSHDIEKLANIFTVDGTIESPSKLLEAAGRDGIRATFLKRYKIRGPSYHWTHDHKVVFDPDDPDLASGLVLGHAETFPNEEACIAALRYEDDYRRVDGQWLFARRVVKFLYYVPVTEYHKVLGTKLRLLVGGARHPADYPETLRTWQDLLSHP
jgi:SnoaL-like domain